MKLAAAFCAASLLLRAQTSEFIADPSPTPAVHASTVVELRPGILMAA
jgi:hypothetical protein